MRPAEQQHEPQPSGGIGHMVAVSAVLHVIVIIFIFAATNRKPSESSARPMVHTVELVAPGVLGPAGGGGGGARPTPTVRPPAEPTPSKPERRESPAVKRPKEPAQEKPEKIQVKEPPPPKPSQARKEVEVPKPQEPPPKVKEPSKVVTAKPLQQEPPAVKPKPPEPAKPKEAVKLPEKIKKSEPERKKPENKPELEKIVKKVQPAKKPENKPEPEPEKVISATDKKPVAKEKPQSKLTDTTPQSAPPVTGRERSESISASNVKEKEADEGREREKQILAAVERARAREEEAGREREIAAALDRVRRNTTRGEETHGGVAAREAPGPVHHEGEGNARREAGSGGEYGAEFIAYTQYIKQRVKEAWILAERKPGLRAVVRFGVEPNGEVMQAELADSSGDRAFDQSALRAVRKASPFPPPPEAYREEFATQKVEITFSGEERIR